MRWTAAVLFASGVAWAALEVPDSIGCRDKPPKFSCLTDQSKKGICTQKMVNTPDFSVPGPPTFEVKPQMICVASAPEHELKDLVALVVGIFVVMGLIVFNIMRKKSLSDY